MFWYLTLAHLLGDYPFQTDKMVQAKRTWWGLLPHVAVHFAVLLFIVGEFRPDLWLYLLVLTAIHYAIDTFKNALSKYKPDWIFGGYLVDQCLHLLSIAGVTLWIARTTAVDSLPTFGPWLVYASAYLFTTYVWFVTERIAAADEADYVEELNEHFWSRMIARAGLLTTFLVIAHYALGTPLFVLAAVIPYSTGLYKRRAFLIDVAVALFGAALILFAT